MSDMSRGEFLGVGAAALATGFGAGCVGSPSQSAPGGTAPDLVVVNGRVLTSEPSQPLVEAFAVKHDRFVAVGSTDDVTHLKLLYKTNGRAFGPQNDGISFTQPVGLG